MVKIEEVSLEWDKNDPEWKTKEFCLSMMEIAAEYQKKKDTAKLLAKFLKRIEIYFENLVSENQTALQKQVHSQYAELRLVLENSILEKKLSSYHNGMTIGKMVADLNFFGMSRLSAIKLIAKELSLGDSTVRTHHEKYKKEHPLGKGVFVGISIYNEGIKELLNSKNAFHVDNMNERQILVINRYKEFLGKHVFVRHDAFEVIFEKRLLNVPMRDRHKVRQGKSA